MHELVSLSHPPLLVYKIVKFLQIVHVGNIVEI